MIYMIYHDCYDLTYPIGIYIYTMLVPCSFVLGPTRCAFTQGALEDWQPMLGPHLGGQLLLYHDEWGIQGIYVLSLW